MASAAKRRSTRKRESNTRQDQSGPAASSTPSRPSKRRKQVSIAVPDPDPETEDNASLASDSDSDEHADELTALADRIVPHLAEAEYNPLVAVEYPSTQDHVVKAYAKIAGRRWTYYVHGLSINVGRAPDKEPSQQPRKDGGGSGFTPINAEAPGGVGGGDEADPDQAHIDLGPSKLVSRLHATVRYQDDGWEVAVKGRNGVKLNGQLLKKGQARPLRSGDVLEIAGNEMIFVTPSVPVRVHDMYLQRLEAGPPPPESATAFAGAPTAATRPPAAGRRGGRRSTLDRSSAQLQTADYLPPPHPPVHKSPYAPANPEAASPNQTLPVERPTTPVRHSAASLLSAPYLAQHARHGPAYEQQLTIESGAPGGGGGGALLSGSAPIGVAGPGSDPADYASDAFKDVKPPMSYATLIAQAILSTAEGKLSLAGIYDWIQANFAYYRHNDGGWQNSIRHNLSLSPDFQREAREAHEPGKGGLWRIADDKRDDYVRKGLKITSRGGARQTSNPNTPAPKRSPKRSPRKRTPPQGPSHAHHHNHPAHNNPFQTLASAGAAAAAAATNAGPDQTSPALATSPLYPRHADGPGQQHQTPSRAPRGAAAPSHTHPAPGGGAPFDDGPALPRLASAEPPTPSAAPALRAAPYLAQGAAASAASPPGLGPSGFYPAHADGAAAGGGGGHPGSGAYQSLYTPAPQRREPSFNAAPPSTGRLPSQWLPQSSPFPFWKEAAGRAGAGGVTGAAGALGLTTPGPGLLPDTSPLKGGSVLRRPPPLGLDRSTRDRADNHRHDNDDASRRERRGSAPGLGLGLHTSSPPPGPAAAGTGSPTAAPARRAAPLPTLPPPSTLEPRVNGAGNVATAVGGSAGVGSKRRLPTPPGGSGAGGDDDGTLDLMGNFPSIAARRVTNAASAH